MLCPNCSAEFNENLTIVCPYCGYEYMKGARQEHQQEIDAIKKKTREVKQQSEKLVRKSTHVLLKVALIFLGVFLIIMLLTFIYKQFDSPEAAMEKQEKKLREFEEIYQSGDYEKLWEEIAYFSEGYSATYRKYYNVGSLYHNYEWSDEANYNNAYYAPRITDVMTTEEILTDLKYSLRVLYDAQTYRDAGYVYGEQTAVEKIEADMKDSIMNYYCFVEEEYRELYDTYCMWRGCAEEDAEAEKLNNIMLELVEPLYERMLKNEIEERDFTVD